MTRVAYFDCWNGAAGDMITGALLDAGGDFVRLQAALEPMGAGGFTLSVDRVLKNGIACAKYRVKVVGDDGGPQPASHHAATTATTASKGDAAGGEDPGFTPAHHGRTLAAVLDVVAKAAIPQRAKDDATRVFRRLAEAEAAVHGIALDDVHFHEVGTLDAIADVVGACFLLADLGVDEVRCSPLPIGRGFVRAAHGMLPVPAPATLKLLKGVPTYDNGERGELVTPTGAAILVTLAAGFGPAPAMTTIAAGYGAGDREHANTANALRVLLGDATPGAARGASSSSASAPSPSAAAATQPSSAPSPSAAAPSSSTSSATHSSSPLVERLHVVEANVDDATGQQLAFVVEDLLVRGALDAWTTAITMKKGRPAATIHALVDAAHVDVAFDTLFAAGITLGARKVDVERRSLPRDEVVVSTPWGDVPVKRATHRGAVVRAEPEYDVCARIAREQGVPLVDVQRAATAAARAK